MPSLAILLRVDVRSLLRVSMSAIGALRRVGSTHVTNRSVHYRIDS